jgi:hypothetical protein
VYTEIAQGLGNSFTRMGHVARIIMNAAVTKTDTATGRSDTAVYIPTYLLL